MKRLRSLATDFYKSAGYRLLIWSYLVAIVGAFAWQVYLQSNLEKAMIAQINDQESTVNLLLSSQEELDQLKAQDPYAENARLKQSEKEISQAFTSVADLFELRADVVATGAKTDKLEPEIAKILRQIGDQEYASASATTEEVHTELVALLPTPKPAASEVASTPLSSSLPSDGYGRVSVSTSRGSFTVAAVVAPGARAIVETASDSDCGDNCPTKNLAEHVAASGGFAGINGAYFCPPDYAKCQGKVNTFDTLAVNGRTKAVLNRDNNVYSTVPLVAMYGGSISFYDQTVQWGVDTGSNGALANYPRLLRDGNVATTEENGKGTRGFVGVKDGAIVIGHVFGASFGDTAEVLRTLGLQNAMNLDGGGSSALWYGGYKVGPGRSLPTAIVLVK